MNKDSWETYRLKDLGEFKTSSVNKKIKNNEVPTKLLNYMDVYNNSFIDSEMKFSLTTAKQSQLTNNNVLKGDVFFTPSSETREDIGHSAVVVEDISNLVYSYHLVRYRIHNDDLVDLYFRAYCFNNTDVLKQFSKLATGSTRYTLSLKDFEQIEIKIPPMKEQQKIASILSTWDEAISHYSDLLVYEKKKKKGLVEASYSYIAKDQSKGTMKVKLSDIIIEQNQRTTENNQYPVLSVTKEGIVLQEDYFNKQIASKDNRGYKIVEYGNVVFSTMNLWMGSLDILRIIDKGIVSPAYKVFKLNEKTSDLNFMNEFLKSNKMIHLYKMNSEQGASVVRRNLDLKSLLSSYVNVPNLELQRNLGNLFYLQNKKIENIELLILQLQEQKRGLMQLLLTGKVRV